jgi:hypothetical protein
MQVVEVSSRKIIVQREVTVPRVINAGNVVRQTVFVGVANIASMLEDYVGISTRYIGVSTVPNASPTANVWRIRKVDAATGSVGSTAGDTFTSAWSDRLSLSYA